MKNTIFRTLNSAAMIMLLLVITGCSKANDSSSDGSSISLKSDATPPIGRIEIQGFEMSMTNSTISMEMQGQSMSGIRNMKVTRLVEKEILAKNKVRLTQIVDSESFDMQIMDQAQNDSKTGPLEGIPLIGVLNEGKWTYTLESGAAPSDEQQSKLDQLSDKSSSDDYYPEHRVQVGDKWELDAKAIKKLMGDDAENVSGTGTMEFREQVTYQGHTCAHLFYEFEAEGDGTSEEGAVSNMKKSMQGEVYRSLDAFIDIEVNATGHLEINEKMTQNEMTMTRTMSGPIEIKANGSIK